MAFNIQIANATVNAEVAAFCALFNSGYLRIYDGVQPVSADTAITTQVLLAELRFSATAWGSPTNGVVSANTITAETNAPASGTATWFRIFKSDGTTVVCDGSVGTANANLTLISTTVTIHGSVSITSGQATAPKS